ncbi:MAG: D-2-hydroxyacid dehydrogenase family protein [Candidatus Methylomirabilales bacterium]
MTRIAVLDDWQRVARRSADWSALMARGEVVFFDAAFGSEDEAARKLAGFPVIMAMRERTAFPASLVRRLPALQMFAMTGRRAGSVDVGAMIARGITVCYTGSADHGEATAELALGLMLAAARHIPAGDASIRAGRFQEGVGLGFTLAGKTLGILGLGRIGTLMAGYGRALRMPVLAWSQNLTAERAGAAGATLVDKEDLLSRSDVVSVHLTLSERTRGLIGARELALMKRGAVLVNTSRGPIVDEAALLLAVQSGRLIAALDVYDREPLPAAHPLRQAPNTVLTPHLGYVTLENLAAFYRQSVENVLAFLDGKPIRMWEAPIA